MMLKGLGDIGNLMKLQKEFKSIQKKIAETTVSGACPDGKVRVTMDGDYRVREISIDPACLSGVEPHELEKMVRSAVNSAVDKVKHYSALEMEKLTGGLNLPGLGSFFK
jgi:DNA-binding YbaB/EbfC family protein